MPAVLHPHQRPDDRRPCRRVLAGERDDLRGGEAGDAGDPLRRVLQCPRAQGVEAVRIALDVVGVVQVLVQDHVHQPKRERGVGSGLHLQVHVGRLRGARAHRVDHNHARACLAGTLHERPQMQVRDDRVCAPENDQPCMLDQFGVNPAEGAVGRRRPGAAGVAAHRSLEIRRAQAVKEALMHGHSLDHALGAHVAVRHDGLRTVLGDDRGQP